MYYKFVPSRSSQPCAAPSLCVVLTVGRGVLYKRLQSNWGWKHNLGCRLPLEGLPAVVAKLAPLNLEETLTPYGPESSDFF